MWQPSQYITVNGIPPSVMKFPGGELQVRVGEPSLPIAVGGCLKSSEALCELLMVTDALKQMGHDMEKVKLTIPYLPYARQDRVCNEGEAFSLGVVARLINGMGYGKVVVFDPHSDVAKHQVKKMVTIGQEYFIAHLCPFEKINGEYVTVVAPDNGAYEKASIVAASIHAPMVKAWKTRDTKTGGVTGVTLLEHDPLLTPYLNRWPYLIVDDICDGGATFMGLARELKIRGAKKVYLFVTHGIFSKGFEVFRGLIDEVFYTNSLKQDPMKSFYHIHRKVI